MFSITNVEMSAPVIAVKVFCIKTLQASDDLYLWGWQLLNWLCVRCIKNHYDSIMVISKDTKDYLVQGYLLFYFSEYSKTL